MSTVDLLGRTRLPDGLSLQLAAKSDGAKFLASDQRRPATKASSSLRQLGVSICSGCVVGSVFCLANKRRFFRPLTAKMLELLSPEIKPDDFRETQINFSEMGDPLLNQENVLQAIDSLTAINPKFYFIVSTAAPYTNRSFYENLAKRLTTSRIRLCFSCHTTSNLERFQLSPKIQMLIFEEIAELASQWPGDPVTLNFIMIDGFTYNVDRLAGLFDSQRVLVAINCLNNNEFVRAAGLREASPTQVARFKDKLSEHDFRWTE